MVWVVDSGMSLPLAQRYKKEPQAKWSFNFVNSSISMCTEGSRVTRMVDYWIPYMGPLAGREAGGSTEGWIPYQTINQLVSWSGVGGPKLGALWADITRCQDVLPLHLSLWGTTVDQQQRCGTAEVERASHRIMLLPAFCLLSQRRRGTRFPFPICTPNRLALTPGSCTLGSVHLDDQVHPAPSLSARHTQFSLPPRSLISVLSLGSLKYAVIVSVCY